MAADGHGRREEPEPRRLNRRYSPVNFERSFTPRGAWGTRGVLLRGLRGGEQGSQSGTGEPIGRLAVPGGAGFRGGFRG